MSSVGRLLRLPDWKTAAMAAVGAPAVVLLHELAHLVALELAGIDAHLCGFSMAMPVGYSWDVEGLEQACVFYGADRSSVAGAVLAGPMTTLLIAYGAVLACHFGKANGFWAGAFAAVGLRTAGIAEFMPRFLDGTIRYSDEAIAAQLLNLPLASFYWPALVLGSLCMPLFFVAAPKGRRLLVLASAFVGGVVGYFAIDALANLVIFRPDTWGR